LHRGDIEALDNFVVEAPPGSAYCDARSVVIDLFRADGGGSLQRHIFANPPRVEVTCYLFMDSAHITAQRTDFFTQNGNREIKGNLSTSPVRGLWEVHPVIKIEKVSRQAKGIIW